MTALRKTSANKENVKNGKNQRFKSLIIEGTKYRTHHTTKFQNRDNWEKPNEKKVYSFIPGTIIKVKLVDGKSVRNGQLAIIFEAMKMKNRVYVPFAGKIKSVNVKEGDMVPRGRLLFEME